MNIYTHVVYWLHFQEHDNIETDGYIGVTNNPFRRLREHLYNPSSKKDKNPFLSSIVKKHKTKIIQTIIFQGSEDSCYSLEYTLRPVKNIGWNCSIGGNRPPSRLGWKPSNSTLEKRSKSLKGIIRSPEWKQNLSESKQGTNNPMYGKTNPCSEDKRIAIIKTKNLPNYELYKLAIEKMNKGYSADKITVELGIGRGVCFKLKNRSHLFFEAFPELK